MVNMNSLELDIESESMRLTALSLHVCRNGGRAQLTKGRNRSIDR